MPRLNNAKDFKGNSYVTTKTFNLPAGITKLFDESTNKIATSLLTIPAESYTSVTTAATASGLTGAGTAASPLALDLSDYEPSNAIQITAPQISLTGSTSGIDLTGAVTFGGGYITATTNGDLQGVGELQVGTINGLSGLTIDTSTGNYIEIGGALKVQNSTDGFDIQVYADGDFVGLLGSDNKLNTALIPDLAITNVYSLAVAAGTNYTSGTTTVNDLIKLAITEAGVQKGDVVILTASDKTVAEAVAGTYIFTADVAAKANIASGNYVKMYAPTGTVTSVNTIAPVAGNVTLNIANIGNVTGVTSFAVASGVTSVNGTALANASDVTTLNTKVGAASQGTAGQEGYIAASGIFARLETIEGQLGTGTGDNSVSARLDALETGLENEVSYRSADDVVLKTAVEKAVEIETVSKTLSGYTKGTVAGADQVVTINDMTAGIVVAVLNASGEQVYPTITYTNGIAILSADYEDGTVDATWTIYKTKAITATLTHTVVDSSEQQ